MRASSWVYGLLAESVRLYNRWFLASAPKAFREQREVATVDVTDAMVRTANLTRIAAATLESHPGILPSLRMAACPPLARDRLVGLASVSKSLVLKMEKDTALPPRMPPTELFSEPDGDRQDPHQRPRPRHLSVDRGEPDPVGDEARMATIVIADRLCGIAANPIIRNAQERRQLDLVEAWLSERRYERIPPRDPEDPAAMPPGSFSFCKEEAAKAGQLRRRLGCRARFVLFLGGYFDSGYLGYEAAEGIDWVWEHRIDDFKEFGL